MGQRLLPKIQVTVKIVLVVILVLTTNSSLFSATPKWFSKLKQIKLLTTTRQEVEKLFDSPKVTDTYEWDGRKVIEYKLKEGELTIVYSRGKCSETNKEGYDVDKDVVIDLDMNLKKDISISELKLDLNGFDRTEIYDLPGVFEYRNENLGEYYAANEFYKDGSKKIRKIQFFSSKSQENLKCKKTQ